MRIRKSLIILLIICMFANLLTGATASNASEMETGQISASSGVYVSAKSKVAFAAEVDAKCSFEGRNAQAPQNVLDELMMQGTLASGEEREKAIEQLNENGIYEYEGEALPVPANTGIEDIALSKAVIYYNSTSKSWTVCSGGYWLNNDWNTGATGNIGDPDAFGVSFTSTSNYQSIVLRSHAYLIDQNNCQDTKRTVSYRSDGNGATGFGFRIQDSVYNRAGIPHYIGYTWWGMSEYDENFSKLSGVATSYYIHTWNSAKISSLTIGQNISGSLVGITYGGSIAATVTDADYSFAAYSADVRINN